MNPDDQNLDQIELDSDVPVTYEQQPEDYYVEETKLNPLIIIYSGLYFFLLLIAIFLSIKCNGIDILALCCACYYAPCYIIYCLATRYDICFR
mgnify:CR=1 FL=1